MITYRDRKLDILANFNNDVIWHILRKLEEEVGGSRENTLPSTSSRKWPKLAAETKQIPSLPITEFDTWVHWDQGDKARARREHGTASASLWLQTKPPLFSTKILLSRQTFL